MLTVKYCMSVQLNKDNSVATTSVSPDTYERLGMRIQKIINSPTAQKAKEIGRAHV